MPRSQSQWLSIANRRVTFHFEDEPPVPPPLTYLTNLEEFYLEVSAKLRWTHPISSKILNTRTHTYPPHLCLDYDRARHLTQDKNTPWIDCTLTFPSCLKNDDINLN